MTTDSAVRRDEDFELIKVAIAEGRDGPQWELSLMPPSIWNTRFPLKGWIEQIDYPQAPAVGIYRCIFERGNLRERYDGSRLWHYPWRLIQFDVRDDTPQTTKSIDADGAQLVYGPPDTAEAKKPSPKVESYGSQEAAKNRSIQRQVALKASVEYLAIHEWKPGETLPVQALAQALFEWLSEQDVCA